MEGLIKGKQRGVGAVAPAPFLTKTYRMVEDGETDEVISWEEKGGSFVVWKPVEFARDLLPVHFKHSNFSSFVRQLNTYGFRKVSADRWEFANDNFRRGEETLLSFILRRKASSPGHPRPLSISGQHSTEVHSSSSTSSPPPPELPHLLNLSNENETLRRENKILNTELAQAKRHCEKLLGFLSKHVDVSQLNLGRIMSRTICFEKVQKLAGDNEEEAEGGKEACLKLFGVLLKVNNSRDEAQRLAKRRHCISSGERLPAVGGTSWAGVSPPVGGSSTAGQSS